jgi:hypothetical protein
MRSKEITVYGAVVIPFPGLNSSKRQAKSRQPRHADGCPGRSRKRQRLEADVWMAVAKLALFDGIDMGSELDLLLSKHYEPFMGGDQ